MDGMATGKDWDRLAEYVRERRTELGITQEDVRHAGGPSTATMRLIEGALQEAYQPSILARLERALRWQPRSVQRILGGGEPAPLDEAAPQPPAIPRSDSGAYAEIDEIGAMLYQPVIRLRLAELAERGDPRPSGETLFLEGGDPLGAGENIAAGLADAWDKGMTRGLDLDTAVKFAARAWALMDAYRARTHNRASGRA